MANVKISDLPAASSAGGTDQLETNQGGTSRRLTVAQVATHVRGTATDTVAIAAGSASAPSLTPTGDSNTGLFAPAADTLAFSTGGTERLRLDASGNATFAGTAAMASSFLRNRIINGDMRIDQRNAGASVTFTNSFGYVIDRYRAVALGTSLGFSSQRSTVAPPSFVNSYLATVTSAKTPAPTDQCRIDQFIEGVNVADLGWGTANAQTVTLSFWVRSSVTGIYCVHLGNDGSPTRSYVVQYTIGSANTWEYKTITIPGDTSGTWNTGTSYGVGVSFALGMGSSFTGTAGWQAGERLQTSSQTNWIANAGATFYLTGVQLEVGTVATPFERRQYGQELALCQRYYNTTSATIWGGQSFAGQYVTWSSYFPVTMRSTPTTSITSVTAFPAMNGGPTVANVFSGSITLISASFSALNTNGACAFVLSTSAEL
ncbi:MAG: Synechococcus phage [Pseudomonadota bacterium]|jgi:hypothetical protein